MHYIVRNLTTFQIKKILIIRLSSLGDVILTEPLCRALREKYPDGQIDFLVKKEFAEVVSLFGSISNVLISNEHEPQGDYDVVLDLHNVLRSMRIRRNFGGKVYVVHKRTFKRWLLVKFKINLLKNTPDIIGRYFETARELGVVDSGNAPRIDLPNITKQKRAAICPGAKHWNKRWLPERFAEVAKELATQGYEVEIHGSASESSIAEAVISQAGIANISNKCGKYSLTELAQRLGECEVAITNDSGLMHLANAVGTRTISIFGPTVGEFGFHPRSKDAIIFENHNLSCRPCTTIGSDSCPKGHFECMKGVTSEMILKSL